ncbi:unnamed protein product [Sphagnum tenellum]
MTVRHRLTIEWRRLGHVVTCGSRVVSSNWGGKGGPTAAGQRIETLWQQFFSDPSRWLDCRRLHDTRISNIRRRRIHSGLGTEGLPLGWMQN